MYPPGGSGLSILLQRLPTINLRTLGLWIAFWLGFLAGLAPIGEYDTWWHLAGGRLIAERGAVVHEDLFSYTATGHEWIMHEWLWELGLYEVYSHLGPVGAILLKAVISGLIGVAMLALALRRGSGTAVGLAVVMLAIAAMAPWVNHRPQVLQPLFVLVALHLIQDAREGRLAGLLVYPALMFLWVNCHGSFPLGLVLLALYTVCQVLRTGEGGLRDRLPKLRFGAVPVLLVVLLLSSVACLLGPNGMRGALYPLDYFDGSMSWATENVTEWRSPNWHSAYMQPLAAMILLLVVALAFSPVAPGLYDVLLALVGVRMALMWGRSVPLAAVLCAPLLATHAAAWLNQVVLRGAGLEQQLSRLLHLHRPTRRAVAWGLLAVPAMVALWAVPWGTNLERQFAFTRFPVRAAEVIALNDLQGNMINVYHWGGYLMWRFYGERLVFMDGRADVYGEAIWRQYRKVTNSEAGWEEVLDRYDVQYVLMDSGWGICRLLDASPRFTRIYKDTRASVYVRNDGPNARVVEAFEKGRLELPPDDLPDRAAILGKTRPAVAK